MGKYSKDLDEKLAQKVQDCADRTGLSQVLDVQAIRLLKSKTGYGEVVNPNEITKFFAKNENMIVIALYEDLLLEFTEDIQDLLIEGLVSQIAFDYEKDKVIITKPEIQVSVGMWRKYGDKICNALETVQLTLKQIEEKKAEEKKQKKEKKQ